MASGKSRLGKRLAQKLNLDFIDLDHYIEQEMNLVVSEIFNQFGEDYFRDLEKKSIGKLIHLENCIVSCGGGTPCFYDNKSVMLNNGLVIYLELEEDELINRLWRNRTERPLVAKMNTEVELRDYVRKHLAERMSYYAQAHFSYDNTYPKSRLEELIAFIQDYQENV